MGITLNDLVMSDGLNALTLKEREALGHILRGHYAKSMARELDLSVHKINERLSCARRKLEVTSGKQAARLFFESEGASPEILVPKQLGDADSDAVGNLLSRPPTPAPPPR